MGKRLDVTDRQITLTAQNHRGTRLGTEFCEVFLAQPMTLHKVAKHLDRIRVGQRVLLVLIVLDQKGKQVNGLDLVIGRVL